MLNQYIQVIFSDGSIGYQVIQNGVVLSYVDTAGLIIFGGGPVPDGIGSSVINTTPPIQAWMN